MSSEITNGSSLLSSNSGGLQHSCTASVESPVVGLSEKLSWHNHSDGKQTQKLTPFFIENILGLCDTRIGDSVSVQETTITAKEPLNLTVDDGVKSVKGNC